MKGVGKRAFETISFSVLFVGILFTSFGLNTHDLILDIQLTVTGLAIIVIGILLIITLNKRSPQPAM